MISTISQLQGMRAAQQAAEMQRDIEVAARNGTAEKFGPTVSLNVLGIFILRRIEEVASGTEFEWLAVNFRAFDDLGIPREVVRGILREMAGRGLVAYERGLFDEDGQVAGSGYRILPKGREVVREWPLRGWLDDPAT
jgi:hypothetical protein